MIILYHWYVVIEQCIVVIVSSQRLLDAVKSDDPIMCLHILAHSSVGDVNYEHPLHNGGSALHVACNLGRIVIVQLLVWVSWLINCAFSFCVC